MLRQRILTAIVAGGLVVAGIFLLAPRWIGLAGVLVAALGGWEWSRLAGMRGAGARLAYSGAIALLAVAVRFAGGTVLATLVLVLAVVWWAAVSAWLLGGGRPHAGHAGLRPGWLLAGLLLMVSLAVGVDRLADLTAQNRGTLLYAVALVWAADIGAYFVGRACGRHRLAPAVSAGKTWEGFWGGMVAVALYALGAAWLLAVPVAMTTAWIGLAVGAGALSVTGDLCESVLKREAGVKDSGRLLPGHGGLLDRIDSLVAAVPVLALGLAALSPAGGS